jgi:hypothetical protein
MPEKRVQKYAVMTAMKINSIPLIPIPKNMKSAGELEGSYWTKKLCFGFHSQILPYPPQPLL